MKNQNLDSLKGHIKQVHQGERNYECKYCGHKFSQPSGLKKHISIIHEKRKDFACPTCGKPYALKSDLKLHILAIHYGVRYAGRKDTPKPANYEQILEEINKILN